MFSYRFLHRQLTLLEQSSSCCLYSNRSFSKANDIKTYNSENKRLFGGLLETQKQRRKKISLTEDEVGLKNLSELDSNGKSKTVKSKKIKKTESQTDVEKNETYNSNVMKNANKEDINCKSKSKKKSKNDNVHSSNYIEPSMQESNILVNKTNQGSNNNNFIFKSAVSINDENYPINNINKNYLLTDHYTEKVMCLGFSHSDVKNYLKFPSVSKVMEDTMSVKSKFILSRWRQNMVADLGEDGFSKHLADLKSRGQEFHQAVRGAVLCEPLGSVSETTRNALRSLEWLLQHVSNPMAVESLTAHPTLGYKGIPDCVAMFNGLPVVIDWKLSDKPKKDLKDTYEAPVQISAYIGALNHDPNYKCAVSHGLVAVAYVSGDPCDAFVLAPKHCHIYWRHWLQRIDKFKARSHLHLDHDIDEKDLQLV